jgi:hypothetical protein
LKLFGLSRIFLLAAAAATVSAFSGCANGIDLGDSDVSSTVTPSVSHISPEIVSPFPFITHPPPLQAITVDIHGSSFVPGAKVYFDLDECIQVVYIDSTRLRCSPPSTTVFKRFKVRVVNPGGLFGERENAGAYGVVVGHANFDNRFKPGTKLGFSRTRDVLIHEGKMIVVDTEAHRILIWNSAPAYSDSQILHQSVPDVVIGQASASEKRLNSAGISAASLNSPSSVVVHGQSLIVADTGNNRVLIWNTIPTASGTPANVVLGQADFVSIAPNRGASADAGALNRPSFAGVFDIDGAEKLVVVDSGNNRVLIWDVIPTTSGVVADSVLGQPDPTTTAAGDDHQDLASSFLRSPSVALVVPHAVDISKKVLFVSDTGNNRVLGWELFIDSDDGIADPKNVIPFELTSESAALPEVVRMSSPVGLASDGTQLAVFDTGNNRVLLWPSVPNTDLPASIKIGQEDGVAVLPNRGPRPKPGGSGESVYISDNSLSSPVSGRFVGNQLWVADTGNSRVLMFSLDQIEDELASADIIVGQRNTSTGNVRDGAEDDVDSIGVRRLNEPLGMAVVNNSSNGFRLYAADGANNRIVTFSSIPTSNEARIDSVLGQQTLGSNKINSGAESASCGQSGGLNACSLNGPSDIFVELAGSKQVIADRDNNRVLVWNLATTDSKTQADRVLGQSDFFSNAPNAIRDVGKATGPKSLSRPSGVFVYKDATDTHHLVVADTGNNRVLIWLDYFKAIDTENPPATEPEPDIVLGQAEFESNLPNQAFGACAADPEPVNACGLKEPTQVKVDSQGRLYVADTGNNRVLIWNESVWTGTSGSAASVVLGQADFKSNGEVSNLSLASLRQPQGISILESGDTFRLFVADAGHDRILIWNSRPTETDNGKAADLFLGQNAPLGGVFASALNEPKGILVVKPAGSSHSSLIISDSGNNRILVIPEP